MMSVSVNKATKSWMCVVFLFATFSSSHAALVNVSVSTLAAPASKFVSSTGANLSTGSIIRVGYFDFGDAPSPAQELILTGSSFSAIDDLFTALGDENPAAGSGTGAITVNNAFGNAGAALGTISSVDNGGFTPSNVRMYVWVFNTGNLGTATEWGIFTASSGWNLPTLGTETLATNEITVGYTASGKLEGASLRDASGNLRLSAIPEPSVSLLATVVGAVMLGRRRR